MSHIDKIYVAGAHAVIRYDREWEEYSVKFFKGQQYQEDADYFTDDKEDAYDTAKDELGRMVDA